MMTFQAMGKPVQVASRQIYHEAPFSGEVFYQEHVHLHSNKTKLILRLFSCPIMLYFTIIVMGSLKQGNKSMYTK